MDTKSPFMRAFREKNVISRPLAATITKNLEVHKICRLGTCPRIGILIKIEQWRVKTNKDCLRPYLGDH